MESGTFICQRVYGTTRSIIEVPQAPPPTSAAIRNWQRESLKDRSLHNESRLSFPKMLEFLLRRACAAQIAATGESSGGAGTSINLGHSSFSGGLFAGWRRPRRVSTNSWSPLSFPGTLAISRSETISVVYSPRVRPRRASP